MIHACQYRFLIAVLVIFLSACQHQKQQPAANAPAKAVASAKKTAPVMKPEPVNPKEAAIKRLLAEADYALSQDQLLMPLSDNAHDRYHAVLLLDRDNAQAKSGLQAITLRYLDMARDAASKSSYSLAMAHVKNARDLDPHNPLVAELERDIKKHLAARPVYVYKAEPGEHLLNSGELSNKTANVVAQLTSIAQQAKASGDLVMIIARNDAEGRWIYQRMRDAVPGYLLRGDIKIGNPPRVQFVPLLEPSS